MKKIICMIMCVTVLLSSCSFLTGLSDLREKRSKTSLAQKLDNTKAEKDAYFKPTPNPVEKEFPNDIADITYDYIDPYNVSAIWHSSHNISVFESAVGVAYDIAETERLGRQVDFVQKIYTAPFENVFPGIKKAKSYVFAGYSHNVFRFDYKHFPFADASTKEITEIYYNAVDVIAQLLEKQPISKESLDFDYATSKDSFDKAQMEEMLSTKDKEFYFGTMFAFDEDINLDVMLIKRDNILSLVFSYRFLLDEQPQLKEQSKPQTPSQQTTAPSKSEDLVRIGTYANEDVLGVGLLWSITFKADHTFEFTYEHEEGTEYFTGNWVSENNGENVVLNIINGIPFTTKLMVDGHKYVIFEDEDFFNTSLYFVG